MVPGFEQIDERTFRTTPDRLANAGGPAPHDPPPPGTIPEACAHPDFEAYTDSIERWDVEAATHLVEQLDIGPAFVMVAGIPGPLRAPDRRVDLVVRPKAEAPADIGLGLVPGGTGYHPGTNQRSTAMGDPTEDTSPDVEVNVDESTTEAEPAEAPDSEGDAADGD